MIDDVRLVVFRSIDAGLVGDLDNGGVEQKDVNFLVTQIVKRLHSKFLYSAQVAQFKGQQSDGMVLGVVFETVVRILHALRVSAS